MSRINAKMLKNVSNTNHWEYANSVHVQEGQINEIYFQLVDLDKIQPADKSKALPDFPLRYIPQDAPVIVNVTFPDINPDNAFTVAASQPFSDDGSIFKVIIPSANVPNSGAIEVSVSENGVVSSFILKNALKIESLNTGSC